MADSAYWLVYVGTVSQKSLGMPYLVKKIIVNENYNSDSNDNDVALLILSRPVAFSCEFSSPFPMLHQSI